MTQEEAIFQGFEAVCKELERMNAKLQEMLEILREGVTVIVEKVDKE